MSCPVCGGIALHADPKPPKFSAVARGFGDAARRVAEAHEKRVTAGFLNPIHDLQRGIDQAALTAAIAGGNAAAIEAAAGTGSILPLFESSPTLYEGLLSARRASGEATAVITSESVGVDFIFNAADPNTILQARTQTADRIRHVADDAKEAVRIVTTAGAELGFTPAQQARAVTQIVGGVPSQWAAAPTNFADELGRGVLNRGRLLHDPLIASIPGQKDKLADEIAAKLAKGPLTQAEIDLYVQKYSDFLNKRRALNIARTETMRASNGGQILSWDQAIGDGALPADLTRRVIIVTPDERLRPTHLQVALQNQQGVKMGESFQVPAGWPAYPPWENLCRCVMGLIFRLS